MQQQQPIGPGPAADEISGAVWGSQTLPRLLTHLTQRPGQEFTPGELQAALPANRESLHRALNRATTIGVIVYRRVGSRYVYRSDPDSALFPEIQSLCAKLHHAGARDTAPP